jgi:hypothetical protein
MQRQGRGQTGIRLTEGFMKTRFDREKAGVRRDARPQREVELIKRAVRNAGGDKDKARSLIAKAFGVRSLDQLPAGLRMTAQNAIEGKL